MTKAKYTPEERIKVMRAKAKDQMLRQWERKRQETGQELGYFGGHRRVRKARGAAKFQKCTACGEQARHWALMHFKDGSNPKNYTPLCQKCHWAYDSVGEKLKQSLTHEQRVEKAKLMWAKRSPEQRFEIISKGHKSRHAFNKSSDGTG